MTKVFINPGHAPGIDPGAVNEELNINEADIALNIGKLVEKYLTAAGCECMLLQSDNLDGEPAEYPEVCRTANQWTADIFVSIHCNSYSNPSANGTEVLIYNKWSPADSLASCIQHQLVDTLKTTDRGVKENPHLCVLRETVMTAVLVETAFISNPNDAQLLINNQDDIARAIARGITDYLCK